MDYSITVFGDLVCLFRRKCCFCKTKQKKTLSRVAVSAYSGYKWYYFHDECLNNVLMLPGKYKKFIDLALEIENEIRKTRLRNFETKIKDVIKSVELGNLLRGKCRFCP